MQNVFIHIRVSCKQFECVLHLIGATSEPRKSDSCTRTKHEWNQTLLPWVDGMAHQTRIHYKQIHFQQTFHDISNTNHVNWLEVVWATPFYARLYICFFERTDAGSISTFVHSQSLAQPTGSTQELVSLSMYIPVGHSQPFTIQTARHGMKVLALAQLCWQVLGDAHPTLLWPLTEQPVSRGE